MRDDILKLGDKVYYCNGNIPYPDKIVGFTKTGKSARVKWENHFKTTGVVPLKDLRLVSRSKP